MKWVGENNSKGAIWGDRCTRRWRKMVVVERQVQHARATCAIAINVSPRMAIGGVTACSRSLGFPTRASLPGTSKIILNHSLDVRKWSNTGLTECRPNLHPFLMDLSPATLNRSDIRVLDSKLCPKVRYCTLSTIIHAQYIHYKHFEEFEHELLCLWALHYLTLTILGTNLQSLTSCRWGTSVQGLNFPSWTQYI